VTPPLSGLYVEELGSGPRVVLVHGDVTTGRQGWARQRPLAERWQLVIPDRPGAGRSAPVRRVDFEAEARELATLLDDGAHVVAHSYGAVAALVLAAAQPESMRSLTVIEPPAYAVAGHNPAVQDAVARLQELWARPDEDPHHFFAEFASVVGERPWPRPPMPPEMAAGVRRLMQERPPWEASIDLDRLATAGVPMMVVSGGHSAAFEAICDVIAAATGARREVLTGARHSVQRAGERFNALLEDFLSGVERVGRAVPEP
jgi:pimeloyl-ACP methyl ester carboxylesterase